MTVFSAHANADHTIYVGGVVDALARQPDGSIDLVIDWKTDVDPDLQQIELYRGQVRDYLDATGAPEGLLVFVTTGQLVRVRPAFQPKADAAWVQESNLGPSRAKVNGRHLSLVYQRRSGRKNSLTSLASASGCSSAAKWPPRAMTLHRRMSL